MYAFFETKEATAPHSARAYIFRSFAIQSRSVTNPVISNASSGQKKNPFLYIYLQFVSKKSMLICTCTSSIKKILLFTDHYSHWLKLNRAWSTYCGQFPVRCSYLSPHKHLQFRRCLLVAKRTRTTDDLNL